MKITTVNYQKTFNLGNYCSEKIGMDIQLDEGDTPELALDIAKTIVHGWHKQNNPGLYVEVNPEEVTPFDLMDRQPVEFSTKNLVTPLKSIDRNAIDRLEKLIDDAGTLEELATYKDDAAKLGLVQHYMDRLKIISK